MGKIKRRKRKDRKFLPCKLFFPLMRNPVRQRAKYAKSQSIPEKQLGFSLRKNAPDFRNHEKTAEKNKGKEDRFLHRRLFLQCFLFFPLSFYLPFLFSALMITFPCILLYCSVFFKTAPRKKNAPKMPSGIAKA